MLVGRHPQRFKNFRLIETKDEFPWTRHEFSLDFFEYRLKQEYVKAVRLRPALIRKCAREYELSSRKAKVFYIHKIKMLCEDFVKNSADQITSSLNTIFEQIPEYLFETLSKHTVNEHWQTIVKERKEEPGNLFKSFLLDHLKKPNFGRPRRNVDRKEHILLGICLLLKQKTEDQNIKYHDILSGDADLPKITATSFTNAGYVPSRRTLYNWLEREDLTFEECLEISQQRFTKAISKFLTIFSEGDD